ncbi:MAG: primase-helicase zinc-binding domain-containing protein [Phycisphaeraceae bacterium]
MAAESRSVVNLVCPHCGAADDAIITDSEGAGQVFCTQCKAHLIFPRIDREIAIEAVDLGRPPEGMWLRQEGTAISVGSAFGPNRAALFMLPFTLAWIIGGAWFVSTGFDGDLFFGLIALVIFLPCDVLLTAMCLMCLAGRVEMTIEGDEVYVFTGVSRFGWRRHFTLSDVASITHREKIVMNVESDIVITRGIEVRLRGDAASPGKRIRFGVYFLEDEHRAFFMTVLLAVAGDGGEIVDAPLTSAPQ